MEYQAPGHCIQVFEWLSPFWPEARTNNHNHIVWGAPALLPGPARTMERGPARGLAHVLVYSSTRNPKNIYTQPTKTIIIIIISKDKDTTM